MLSIYNRIISVILKNKYLITLFSILLGMCLILYRTYIFGGRLFLFEDFGSDSVRVSLPTYIWLYDWFRSGMSLWSDKMGIGTSILSHGDIIFDPFTYILFLFGRDNILYMFVYIIVAKIILSGVFFWFFLSKYKLSPYAKLIGAIVYAFGGYMVVVGQNYVLGTIYVYLPLILLSFEMWFQEKKKWPLITMLSLTALYFFYLFYMTAIFLAIYVIFRYFSVYRFEYKRFTSYLAHIIFYGFLSLGLTAFYWLPFLDLTLNNLRVGSSFLNIQGLLFPQFSVVATAIGRFLNYDIFGNPEAYAGFNRDYFQLALFSGVISLIMVPQIFAERNKRKKGGYMFFFITLLILLISPFFSYIFNGFSDFTYRWTYIIHASMALFLALATDSVFDKKKLNYKILLVTISGIIIASLVVAFILGLMAINPGFSFRTRTETSQFFASIIQIPQQIDFFASSILRGFRMLLKDYILVFAYTLLIILFLRIRYTKITKLLVLALVCFEMIWFPKNFINNRITTNPDPIKSKIGYFDNTESAVNYLKSIDGEVYRIDKSYDSVISEYGRTPSNNEAMVQGYRGLKSYNANNHPSYIRFLQDAGIFVKYPGYVPLKNIKPQKIVDANLNYINGVGDRYLLQSFLGVKYYLTKKDENIELPFYYQYLTTIKDINIYKNNYYLPLGFTFDSFMTRDEFSKLSNLEKDLSLLSFAIVDNAKDVSKFLNHSNSKTLDDNQAEEDLENLINSRRNNSLRIISYSEDNILGRINLEGNNILVLTIPYDDGWRLYVDGKYTPKLKVDNGLIGILLKSGSHTIRLRYFPSTMILGIVITIATVFLLAFLSRKNFVKIFAKLSKS